MKKQYIDAIKRCVLFNGVKLDEALEVIDNECRVGCFSNNETIYTRNNFNKCVGIVLEGSVEVYKDEEKIVMLNRINSGGFFGAAALFTDKREYVSVLVAKGVCSVLFIPFEVFKKMLIDNSIFALNYIGFLSGRIEFLNKKIDEFTAQDTNQKLCRYLLDNAVQFEDLTVCSVKSMVELSKNLNMGRASLYRAFEELEKEKIIIRNGKNIVIDDIDKLKKRGF